MGMRKALGFFAAEVAVLEVIMSIEERIIPISLSSKVVLNTGDFEI